MVPELVPREELAAAVSLSSVAFNICLGTGALIGAAVLPKIRPKVSQDVLTSGASPLRAIIAEIGRSSPA
jgi:predicted MFS family arabinose efflux permease